MYKQGASGYTNVHGLDSGYLCHDPLLYIQLREVQDLEDLNSIDFEASKKACRDCPGLKQNRIRVSYGH